MITQANLRSERWFAAVRAGGTIRPILQLRRGRQECLKGSRSVHGKQLARLSAEGLVCLGKAQLRAQIAPTCPALGQPS
ncbi:hypothetical protein MHYP_G00164950 [Metynnis hypsauchen]